MQTLDLYKKDIYKGNLILVNKEYPYQIDDACHYVPLFHDLPHVVHPDVSRILHVIFDKYCFNDEITVVSAYRSAQEQQDIYKNSLLENGQDYTKKFVALPHCSEHETGLAIDFALKQDNIDFICPQFPYEGVCQKFRDLSYEYGFIERYSEDKQTKTHIAKEPWHFRYVGFPHSMIMKEKNLCLEEYHDFIKQYSLYQPYTYVVHQKLVEIFYVKLEQAKTTICLKDHIAYQVSGNNIDGVIITAWRTCL